MLDYKDMLKNIEGEESNNSLIRDANDKYRSALRGEPQGNEKEGASKIVLKVAKMALLKATPTITEPFLSSQRPFYVYAGRNIQKKAFLERYMRRVLHTEMFFTEMMEKAVKKFLTEKIMWLHLDWERDIVNGKYTKNRPNLKVLEGNNVFFDSSATNRRDLTFVGVRENVNKNKLKVEVEGKEGHNKEQLKMIDEIDQESTEISEDDSTITIKSRRASEVTVIRYYGIDYNKDGELEGVEAVWLEGQKKILYSFKRDYVDDMLPFYFSSFDKDVFGIDGEPFISFLLDNQRIQSGLVRGILDNLENANNEKIFIDGRKVEPETILQYNSNDVFVPIPKLDKMKFRGYNAIPQSTFQLKNELEREANDVLGTNSREQVNGNSKLGDDKQNMRINISELMKISAVRKIGEQLSFAMKDLLVMSDWYLSESQKQYLLQDAQEDYFENSESVIVSSTVEDGITKSRTARDMNLLLQQSKENAKYLDEHARQAIVADLVDSLNKPGIADLIRAKDTAPSAEEQMANEANQRAMELKFRREEVELNAVESKAKAELIKAETERMKAEAEIELRKSEIGLKEELKREKSLGNTEKTMNLMDGLEGQGSDGLETTEQKK